MVVIGYIKECVKTIVDRQRIHHSWVWEKVISRCNSVYGNDTKTVATMGLSCCFIWIIIQVIGLETEYIISRETKG